ncbi:MAG: type II toxin-antitoxin system RelE/ParE family toxin [Chitinivibrionales bacterium]|nr:type II toxin-antitoxin system RelE/ParE family toxin [Chitinivibrionales bacterium]
MNISFHPEAEEEFLREIDYYENCKESLGYDFALEVFSAMDRIIAFPSAWPTIDKSIRRCMTHRFPYGLLYECTK